jgi:hypothetical protein
MYSTSGTVFACSPSWGARSQRVCLRLLVLCELACSCGVRDMASGWRSEPTARSLSTLTKLGKAADGRLQTGLPTFSLSICCPSQDIWNCMVSQARLVAGWVTIGALCLCLER